MERENIDPNRNIKTIFTEYSEAEAVGDGDRLVEILEEVGKLAPDQQHAFSEAWETAKGLHS